VPHLIHHTCSSYGVFALRVMLISQVERTKDPAVMRRPFIQCIS